MLFIFDWDGTISDSAARIVSCMQKTAQAAGFEVRSATEIKNIIGLGLPEAIQVLYPGISQAGIETIRDGYSKYFSTEDVEPSPFFAGAMDTLQALRGAGHYMAVATGKSRRGLNRVLSELGMERFFHGSRCADETASKPNPMMLEQLLEEFSTDVGSAVMIGDTEYDMAMAKQLGMARIAVSFGAHHIDRLKPYEPVLCVDKFPEILEWATANNLS